MTREYPQRPIVAVAAVVWRGDKVLLVRRGKAPAQGEWSLPGGAQELGETTHESLIREVREETGLTIEIGQLVGVIDSIHNDDRGGRVQHHYTILDYTAVWRGGEPRAGDDVTDAQFVSLEELSHYRVRPQTEQIIRKSYREWLTHAARQNA
jgi:ADP-ribose pyrophosphatase YjhB (NUDIX family)